VDNFIGQMGGWRKVKKRPESGARRAKTRLQEIKICTIRENFVTLYFALGVQKRNN
jgi:hypothetical protein